MRGRRLARGIGLLPCLFAAFLSGCGLTPAELAPLAAQPKTPVARNFTSFSGALQCLDGLLLRKGGGGIPITSTDIRDETGLVRVGADDMLINAISQTNRRSGRYFFLDQALEQKDGQIAILTERKDDELAPYYYIRGSISQLDQNAVHDSARIGVTTFAGNTGLRGGSFDSFGALSVVSVDMHLVAYPSRRVLSGGSVANSMVVVQSETGFGADGLIRLAAIGGSIRIRRLESRGQAVRHLVELGTIELLGRHSGVPYWTCLDTPETVARETATEERDFTRSSRAERTATIKDLMVAGGLIRASAGSDLDADERRALALFQKREGLIPSGRPDYDTYAHLLKHFGDRLGSTSSTRRSPGPVSTRPASARSAATTSSAATARKETSAVAAPTRPPSAAAVGSNQPPSGRSGAGSARTAGCKGPGEVCSSNYRNIGDFF